MSTNDASQPLDLSPCSKRLKHSALDTHSSLSLAEFPECDDLMLARNVSTRDLMTGRRSDNSSSSQESVSLVSGTFGNCLADPQFVSVLDRKKKLLELEVRLPILERRDVQIDYLVPFAEGGQGKIFIGSWAKTKVAIKSFNDSNDSDDLHLDDEMLNIREIVMLERIRHPNRITFMAVACLEREYWLLMEFFHGKDLHELIFFPTAKKGPFLLTEKRKNTIAYQVSLGMHFLHQQQPPILHRDIKPSNIMMDLTGIVKIVDFGLAKASNLLPCMQTEEGGPAKGTLRYIAPEILIEKKKFSLCSDVWSMASTILELYTAKFIWPEVRGLFATDIMKKIFEKKQQPCMKDVPKFLRRAMELGFNYDANNRLTTLEFLNIFQNVNRF